MADNQPQVEVLKEEKQGVEGAESGGGAPRTEQNNTQDHSAVTQGDGNTEKTVGATEGHSDSGGGESEKKEEAQKEGARDSSAKKPDSEGGADNSGERVYVPAAVRRLKGEANPFLKMSNGDGQGVLEGEGTKVVEVSPSADGDKSANGAKPETPAPVVDKQEEDDEDLKIRLVPNAPHEGKRVYDTAFLLSFKSFCKEKPDNLPDLDINIDSSKRKNAGERGRGGGWQGGGGGGGTGRGSQRGRGRKVVAVPKAPAVPIPPPDEKTWQPSRRAAAVSDSSAALAKKVVFILNRLTLEMFEPLSAELLELVKQNVTDVEGFTCVIKQVFDKALREPQFSKMYAELCQKLQNTCPSFDVDGKKMNFRRILLNECQYEFEQKAAVQEKLKVLSAEDKSEEELKLRTRVLNNIIFIGELFKLRMLTDKIMHGGVIRVLLNEEPTHLDLEALCRLFSTIGKLLEEKSQAGFMEQYFKRLKVIAKDEQYPSRIRFLVQDVIDLRTNRWIESKDDKPKTREQLKKAEQDKRAASPPRQGGRGGAGQNPPRRVPSAGSLAPARREPEPPKGQGEWEVVGGKQGQRPSRRGDNKPGAGKGDWEGGRGKGGGGGGRGDRKQQQSQQRRPEGGRGGDSSRGGGGPKRGPQNASQQPPSGRRQPEKDSAGNKKPAAPATSVNPFDLLMGGMEDAPEEQRDSGKKRAAAKPTQELYVPSHRRKQREPLPDDDKLEDVELVVPGKAGSAEEEKNSKVDGEILMLLEEYLCSHDEEEAAECLKELNATHRHPYVITKGIEISLEKRELDREKLANLFGFFKTQDLISEQQASAGFEAVLKKIPEYDSEIPYSSKYVGVYLGRAVLDGLLPLSFLNKALEHLVSSGKALVIATEAIATIAQNSAPDDFQKLYQNAKIDLLKFVKEENRNAEFLNNYMEKIKVGGAGLSSLLSS